MALLQEKYTQNRLHLRALHLFGRNRVKVDTAVENADVSQIHASIRWDGSAWLLYDHSRNGTYVNLTALAHGASHFLAPGETVCFARNATQSWTVLNLDPPCPLLLPADTGQPVIALEGLRFLPDEHMPEAAIFQDEQGQWLYEDVDGYHMLMDGDTLCLDQKSWRYFNGMSIEATAHLDATPGGGAVAIGFNFAVSQNEEHVELSIITDQGQVDLGERSHHYGLLTLARQRLLDAQRGFDSYSQGWLGTEQLADMLRIDPKHLNMQMHRARHQISEAFCPGRPPVNVIERRRGELRFGSFLFQIKRGAQLEALFDPRDGAFG